MYSYHHTCAAAVAAIAVASCALARVTFSNANWQTLAFVSGTVRASQACVRTPADATTAGVRGGRAVRAVVR